MQSGLLYREVTGAGARSSSSVAYRIGAHAHTSPSHLALVDGSIGVTFGELDRRSNQLAKYLGELGAGPEQCVALLLDRSVDFVVAALAVLKSGAAYLPLDSSTPADRAEFILNDAKARLVVSHRGKDRGVGAASARVVEIDGADVKDIAAKSDAAVEFEPALDSLAYIIYTSGSTGQPKGVEITHANLANLIEWHQLAFEVTAQDRASQVAGVGFDAAVWEIWPHLTAGATLHIADETTRRSSQCVEGVAGCPAHHDRLRADGAGGAITPSKLAGSDGAADISHRRRHAASPTGGGVAVRAREQLRSDGMHGGFDVRRGFGGCG